MSKVEKFEDLKVWQSGLSMSIEIYKTLANCRDYGLKDQMCRSAVSIPSNIAEGFEKEYNKEFIRFLRISKGSAGELRTQIYVAQGIGIIDNTLAEKLLDQCRHISSMLRNLIKTREERF
ncbi:four helix bundle protein [Arcticibacterium luteifluviistationis]|uniref:Four helix bundle protein n=1 Tax=Arcticibacterium luteifluviistationis TaxID=1784714 RepID=A0A2Z4GFR4_9BACT|nr:four helix bundle protein [Arcticibacterium luteifluviistationis]AWW00012.1 four helix bundle protein [Arcticibacterium luteifluviistationis]